MIRTVRRSASRPLLSVLVTAGLALAAGCGTARNETAGSSECTSCHGTPGVNAAPPLGASGQTATTDRGVGAHQAHLTRSTFAAPVACGECHLVPATAAEHVDGIARVALSGRAAFGQGTAAWTPGTATCSGVYCHGARSPMGGSFTTPVWNAAGQGHLDCGSCHGSPPADHGANATDCHACHPDTVRAGSPPAIDVAKGKHLNGVVDRLDAEACDGCHGAPPATGAHLAHVGFVDLASLRYGDEWRTEDLDPSGARAAYSFGCGACHPKDPARHRDGVVEVEVTAAGGEAGGLRARNGAGAAFSGATCSNVSCHSNGRETPSFVTTPGWTSGERLGCGGCHGNPPAYANGGPDGQANSHLFLNWYGREGGHFAPLPGTFHQSRHGNPAAHPGQQAAPMTCQTCHAATVDPANTAPGGLFYLDATLTTRLPGGDAARLTDPAWLDTQCTSCHGTGTGAPPLGGGKVRPVKHVNGTRDVAFDGRLDVPVTALGALAPTRPYFSSDASLPVAVTLPAGSGWDPAAPAAGARATLSHELSRASYDPSSRTCSSVGCHLGQPVRWGQKDFETAAPTCTGCHALP